MRLVVLLREHHEPLTADFRRYYGMSVAECRERGLPLREVAAMATHLPPDSATARAINPPTGWGITEYLLAAAVDALHAANWQRGGGRGPRPTPVERPGVTDQSTETQRIGASEGFDSIEEMDAWFAARRAKAVTS